MPIDEFLDVRLPLTDADLDHLDRQAQRAAKILERVEQQRAKAGGIFGARKGGQTLPKGFVEKEEIFAGRFKGEIGQIGAPIKRETFGEQISKQKGILEGILRGELGPTVASNAIGLLKDPKNAMIKIFSTYLPELAGVVAFVETIKTVIEELVKPGMPLDIYFKDTITTLVNALRSKYEQQSIRMGFTQEIITMRSGFTAPRDSYNTFRLAEKNKTELEKTFMVRVPKGY